ncbi:bromodomain-containing protein, putative [Babesia ovata]|uniref:Bromodomain-containing protein, putative n=1 Tax=Babesia ovata TaxID=189622 RepID=A0A2H6KCZ0_9APIC|nr:bromodomain-containing protein, putative [Babesia ovata]GBE60861.1 bromodomain-containing protein, putative [Babesia ovata]
MENGKIWRQFCAQKILKRMRGDRFGTLFAHPVLEASDSVITPAVKESYRAIIANPMDYKTVKTKLDNGIYVTPDEFRDDMLLIYDNCMRFNPPIGVNKWIYDAAETNKAKFEKMWQASQDKIEKLLAKAKVEPQKEKSKMPKNNSMDVDVESSKPNADVAIIAKTVDTDAAATAPLQSFSDVAETVATVTDVASEPASSASAEPTATTQPAGSEAPHQPSSKFSFRLNLQAIQEYKRRLEEKARMAMPPEPQPEQLQQGEVMISDAPEPQTATAELLPAAAADVVENTIQREVTPNSFFYDETPHMPEVDMDETAAMSEVDMDQMPPIASRRENSILQVNWLSENECNQLFPHCSIIGLHQRKMHYNVSDLALRCIYNELYMNERDKRANRAARDLMETTVKEDYTIKHHKLINFLLEKPAEPPAPTPCTLNEFADGDANSLTDVECYAPSPSDHDTVRDSTETLLSTRSDDQDYDDRTPRAQRLRIELSSETTIGVGAAAERVLLKSGFRKVSLPNCTVKCAYELSFTSDHSGYYKLDESEFMYNTAIMRHMRLFLVNCGTAYIDITRHTPPLAELILKHGMTSEVHELYLESRRRVPKNLAFFQLPHAGPVSYAANVDVLWRIQTMTSALPKPLIVLHLVCRDMN